ncbi:MAG TPA: type III PLP-dependent enzyme [Methanoregulaceae archaeon]|nr:type III PLP-dependent enzyme [Methanoregulaceae archaeon]HPA08439.1 type III PLP-dependent enzyme [Methanoregulaceae archaeon]HQN89445.1 type III PLP-dependent enzyme [Methanoregulaceae archaeon]HQP82422.1 type III PLP-dependent enzyme [Methanoregulaceae archaeon]
MKKERCDESAPISRAKKKLLQELAREHGTPIFVIDHEKIRQNYREFRQYMPDVQVYFAVKANSTPSIVKTLYDLGGSFDVASLPEFMIVYENIKGMPEQERLDWIWDKIIYANTIKPIETLQVLDQYKPLVTFDNHEELKKIRQYAPHAGLVLRLRVPNTGSMVELSSKFGADPGEAVDLIEEAFGMDLVVEGLSFHVGSQCTNFENYMQALQLSANIIDEAESRLDRKIRILDIGGGFPVKYHPGVKSLRTLAKKLNAEIKRLFPPDMQILAEPGRFLVANACTLVAKVVGKTIRDGKPCYYINDGVYHTYSGQIFDHCTYPVLSFKPGERQLSAVFGPTCDSFDTITLSAELPELDIGDLVFSENIGAYSIASSTYFNGFPPAKVVNINQ